MLSFQLFAAVVSSLILAQSSQPAGKTTTLDIREYLLSNSPWVKLDKTVDTVKTGDPSKPVKKAGVCWYPSIENIRAAAEAGCDLLICHEPTFWEHAAPEKSWREKVPGIAKRELLEKTGMVVLRIHDSWDQWPELGIRDSWANYLGFEKRIFAGKENNYLAVYEVPQLKLRDFAKNIAARIKPLGEDRVQVIGDPDRVVSRPALGVGCIVPDQNMIDAGADVLIMCYDGASYWQQRERLVEAGAAVITVEHGTSEMPGMESLCKHLSQKFPNIEFQYFDKHPKTWSVCAE